MQKEMRVSRNLGFCLLNMTWCLLGFITLAQSSAGNGESSRVLKIVERCSKFTPNDPNAIDECALKDLISDIDAGKLDSYWLSEGVLLSGFENEV